MFDVGVILVLSGVLVWFLSIAPALPEAMDKLGSARRAVSLLGLTTIKIGLIIQLIGILS